MVFTDARGFATVTTSAYDRAGNKTTETDRLGRVSTFVYDAADRLVEERWQASASTAVFHTITWFYDGSDQLLGVTETDTTNPAATTAWQFSYDALGQVVKSRMAPGEIVQSVRPPQPILTAQIASRVDLVHPVSKEGGYGSAGGSAEVFGVAATAEAV
ncbi:MAG: hypothetical protein ACK5SI_16820 [Planctomycetia bacterium]